MADINHILSLRIHTANVQGCSLSWNKYPTVFKEVSGFPKLLKFSVSMNLSQDRKSKKIVDTEMKQLNQ